MEDSCGPRAISALRIEQRLLAWKDGDRMHARKSVHTESMTNDTGYQKQLAKDTSSRPRKRRSSAQEQFS